MLHLLYLYVISYNMSASGLLISNAAHTDACVSMRHMEDAQRDDQEQHG